MEANNMAAMREALENIKQEAETTWEYRDYPIAGAPGERGACPVVDADWIIDACGAALAAPPRNCDRFADELDAQLAFLNEVWLISVDRETMLERDKYENWTDEMRKRYGRWLLAPAAERKGEGR